MKNMLRLNNKGVSEMVGYVILIVIALALSIIVYTYLKLYVPKEPPECQNEIHLIIQDYSCDLTSNLLNITFRNKGTFKVDAAFLRLGPDGKNKVDLNKNNGSNVYFAIYPDRVGLYPDNVTLKSYNISNIRQIYPSDNDFILEIQPAAINTQTRKLLACEGTGFTREISCS